MYRGRILRATLVVALLVALAGTSALAASPAERQANGIIAFLTDFGTRDFYVGAIKGVALSAFPEARLVDITHEIEPYDVREGAITLLLAAREFPAGTTFVAVVDPGVGTERRPILLTTQDGRFFLAPDNGLLTLVMQEFGIESVRHVTNREYWRPGPTSYSFHGRDVFTPTAARIASGWPAANVGPEISDYITLDINPARREGATLRGEVVLIDFYGNLQANISAELVRDLGLKYGDRVRVTVGERTVESLFVNTYGDVPEGDHLIFLASTDLLEISINMGSAQDHFQAELGSPVVIERLP